MTINNKQSSQKSAESAGETSELKKEILEEIEIIEQAPSPQDQVKHKSLETLKESISREPMAKELRARLKKRTPRQAFLFAFILGLIIVALGVLLVEGIGIYVLGWNDIVTKQVIKVVPYPAAVVNYKFLLVRDFQEEVVTLERFYTKQREMGNGLVPILSSEEIKKTALDKMVKTELLRYLASKYEIEVLNDEVEEFLAEIINQAGSREEVEKILLDFYNWDLEQFKANVLVIDILRGRISEALEADEEITLNLEDYLDQLETEIQTWRLFKF